MSAHGYDELVNDDLTAAEILDGLPSAVAVEEYLDYHKGPCVLVLQSTSEGSPVHALWGIANADPEGATLITAYRPDPDRWTGDYLKRRSK
ncbi:DUF4258 domain-containing protein [Pseudaminobacter soli (ex Zhang et al. 2022)]|uniref:DUF4258 domain-containing protein n=1 Tax=Pseudaminobacter soli (ex Zhang et al. 2022) TaxID=2831468 RepID=UPI003CC7EAFF